MNKLFKTFVSKKYIRRRTALFAFMTALFLARRDVNVKTCAYVKGLMPKRLLAGIVLALTRFSFKK